MRVGVIVGSRVWVRVRVIVGSRVGVRAGGGGWMLSLI